MKKSFWADIYTGYVNAHETHVTYNSTKNNALFFVSDLKIVNNNNYYFSITMPWTREEKIFLHHYLFGDKIVQNCLKIDATH